ncbi:MAG: hypothetical protein SNF33_01935 [Candidatus Algichlamydia australiensis]|nr:hypothetical protein [Chlamydiales bacterium]
MKNSLSNNQTLAELLASSVMDLFPKAQILYTSGSREGFFTDVIFPDPFAKEQMAFIEQRMREKIAKGVEVRKLDMLGESLTHFLKDQGQIVAAALLNDRLGEVLPVIQIDRYANLCEQPFTDELDASWSPKIKTFFQCEPFTFRDHQESVTRISGFEGQKSKKKSHIDLGKPLFSFFPKRPVTRNGSVEIFWHGEGSRLFSQIISLWKQANIEEVKLPPGCTLKEYVQFTGKKSAGTIREEIFHNQNFIYGLLDPLRSTQAQTIQLLPKKNIAKTLISLLQFSAKTYKMLDLKWHAYLTVPTQRLDGHDALVEILESSAVEAEIALEKKFVPGKGLPRISLRVKDVFQKEWTVSTLLLEKVEGDILLSHKLFTSIERLIALMLENSQGLPRISENS